MVGDPREAKPTGVSWIEETPPLREVWVLAQQTTANWFNIMVVSDLQGPKYLAAGNNGDAVYLAQDTSAGDADWYIELHGPYVFMISKSSSGQGPWLKMNQDFTVSLSNQPTLNWVIQPLVPM